MAKNKRLRVLDDWVDNLQGSFVEKVYQTGDGRPITPDSGAEVDQVCKIKYYPPVDIMESPVRWFKSMLGLADPILSDRKYPDESVYPITLEGTRPGQPSEVMVIEEDQYGNSPYADKVDRKHEKKLSTLQSQRNRARKDTSRKEIENLDSDDRNEDDDQYRRGRGGHRGDDFEIDGIRRGEGERY